MKKIAMLALTVVGLTLSVGAAKADWGTCCYGGYHKCCFWNHHCKKCDNCEEQRWQQFWHDYYDALQHYYDRLDNIDWVTYYKFHGYMINSGACGGPGGGYCRPQYAPVFVSPTMQWAVPSCTACPPGGPMPH